MSTSCALCQSLEQRRDRLGRQVPADDLRLLFHTLLSAQPAPLPCTLICAQALCSSLHPVLGKAIIVDKVQRRHVACEEDTVVERLVAERRAPLRSDGVDVGSCTVTAPGLSHEAYHVVCHVQVVRDRLAADVGLCEEPLHDGTFAGDAHALARSGVLFVDGEHKDIFRSVHMQLHRQKLVRHLFSIRRMYWHLLCMRKAPAAPS